MEMKAKVSLAGACDVDFWVCVWGVIGGGFSIYKTFALLQQQH